MTNDCKNLLNSLIAMNEDSNNYYTLRNFHQYFPKITTEEFISMLKFLKNNGYITYDPDTTGNLYISLTHKGKHYAEFEKSQHSAITQTFNISGTVTNSAFGNTGDVTINNGASFDEVLNYISTSDEIDEADRQALRDMLVIIQSKVEDGEPLKKGFLRKFGDCVQKYGPLCAEIANIVFKYFIAP